MKEWELSWVWKKWLFMANTLQLLLQGIMSSALFFIQNCIIKKKGPIFASAFSPLCTVIVVAMEPILLKLDIYVGGIVGIIVVICRLYSLLWGKAKDKEASTSILPIQNEGEDFTNGDEKGDEDSLGGDERDG
ncbi:hypothetical protein AMTR_s00074p00158040 [Amborella trichopoda]|uniref:WAT1-related protein n=1 Tax=Amborella trichopoda TaxID=13333 RepID=W1NQ94_AMBTC|nr:hypothetical protein AMTR_s00074p00158040 [Amborella trichopoda]